MTSYWKSITIKMPHRYNTDIQSLRAGFIEGGGNVIAQVENGGIQHRWKTAVELSGPGVT